MASIPKLILVRHGHSELAVLVDGSGRALNLCSQAGLWVMVCFPLLQQEVGLLRKQLQAVRSKLLQSEQREADAQVQIEGLQDRVAAQAVELREAGARVELSFSLASGLLLQACS